MLMKFFPKTKKTTSKRNIDLHQVLAYLQDCETPAHLSTIILDYSDLEIGALFPRYKEKRDLYALGYDLVVNDRELVTALQEYNQEWTWNLRCPLVQAESAMCCPCHNKGDRFYDISSGESWAKTVASHENEWRLTFAPLIDPWSPESIRLILLKVVCYGLYASVSHLSFRAPLKLIIMTLVVFGYIITLIVDIIRGIYLEAQVDDISRIQKRFKRLIDIRNLILSEIKSKRQGK